MTAFRFTVARLMAMNLLFAATIFPAAAQQVSPGPQVLRGQQLINDYPTSARADYVFGCMAANGQTRNALERCSCSIDIVASILPYDKYVEAETVLSLRLLGGEKASMFKTSAELVKLVDNLRRAQAEAEFRCF
jgi:lysyl-tRNA synthetase class II